MDPAVAGVLHQRQIGTDPTNFPDQVLVSDFSILAGVY
jgi:hypothetical protein